MTTNVEAVAAMLVRNGVDTLFGLIGNGNLDLVAEMTSRHGVHYVSVRHENAAVAAADGFARAGDRLGVATVTHGPGLTNAMTALVTAHRAQSRLLLIAGNASFNTGRSTQRLDHKTVIEALGVPVIQPAPDGDWAAATEEALGLAQEGAVLLDLPASATRKPAHTGGCSGSRTTAEKAPVAPTADQVRAAATLIAESKRVVIVAGRGALRTSMRDAVVELARQCGALLATSLPAKGLFHGLANDIGVAGGVASPRGRAACLECDLLIAVGASLNGFTTDDAKLFSKAKVIRLDRDPNAPASIPVDLAITGDLFSSIEALRKEIALHPRPAWTPSNVDRSGPLTWPDRALDEVEHLLPKDRTLVFDHGDLPNAALMRFSVSDPTQWIFMPDFGSLGLSVAAALGAATARPDRRAVAVVGDGGLMMSLSEIDTLKRAGLPVLVLVLNNGCYGAEYPHLKHLGASLAPATFDSASFATIARAIGIKSASIGDGDNLGTLADVVSDTDGPALIELRCSPP
jgi:thiamine pyrophosphate-dependent acetolactate synthase large subunit-like protein